MGYVMNILASCMEFDELEGAKTRRYFIYSSEMKENNNFTLRHPFRIHFRYSHQVYEHNNQRHAKVYLERTWATKFWTDRNFNWYLSVS